MHDPMNNLMNDQALVEVTLRQAGIRRILYQRRDIRFLRYKHHFSLWVEKPKDHTAEWMADLA